MNEGNVFIQQFDIVFHLWSSINYQLSW